LIDRFFRNGGDGTNVYGDVPWLSCRGKRSVEGMAIRGSDSSCGAPEPDLHVWRLIASDPTPVSLASNRRRCPECCDVLIDVDRCRHDVDMLLPNK